LKAAWLISKCRTTRVCFFTDIYIFPDWKSLVHSSSIAIMTYEAFISEACESVGGTSFGGRFVSRAGIKKWLLEQKNIDCEKGVCKNALKRALVNFEKKGDSYRISKEMREKKSAAAKAEKKKEKAREKKAALAAKKLEKKAAAQTKKNAAAKPAKKKVATNTSKKKPVKKVKGKGKGKK